MKKNQEKKDKFTENLELHDVSLKSGKERDWNGKKKRTLELAEIYRALHIDSKADRLEQCANFLEFYIQESGELKLKRMNSCRVRLCPICGWRRSLKIHSNMMKIMSYIYQMHNEYDFLMLTLTVPNISGEELEQKIDEMMYAWRNMQQYKKFKAGIAGWYRGLEVTRSKRLGNFHPHFHIVLCVEKKYFTRKDMYIPHEEWLEMWRKATGDSSITQVDIRKIKPGKKGIVSAVCEVAKYTVKDRDYITGSKSNDMDTVRILDSALHGKRLVAYGGLLKEVHKMLNLEDEMNGNLVNIDGEAVSDGTEMDTIIAFWNVGYGKYYIKEK